MIDRIDLETCRVGLLWIRRHRELHRQPPSAAIERALAHLSVSANGRDDGAPHADWITTAELAARLGCSQRHARRLAARIGARVGRQWLIPPEVLEE